MLTLNLRQSHSVGALKSTIDTQRSRSGSLLSGKHYEVLTDLTLVIDEVVGPATDSLSAQNGTIRQLSEAASKHPFYKYNGLWTREIQTVIYHKLYAEWLRTADLLSLEQVGEAFGGKSGLDPVLRLL